MPDPDELDHEPIVDHLIKDPVVANTNPRKLNPPPPRNRDRLTRTTRLLNDLSQSIPSITNCHFVHLRIEQQLEQEGNPLTPSPGVKRLVVDAEVMGHLVHDSDPDFLQ